MVPLTVHRVNFFEPQPSSIRCISYDKKRYLAVSRADSSIEIWDCISVPCIEKVFPGLPDISIESLTWCKGRLFSAGLDGYLREHDLINVTSLKSQTVATSGSPVWCIKADKTESWLATGNEDGHVSLYKLSSDGLDFDRKFDKQEGHILCLDWHASGKTIVTGSVDTIRVWNVESGHVVNRIILARESKNTSTVVWSIAVLNDLTIISGDSCGKTSFWDGKSGTPISTSNLQSEAILAIAVNEDESTVYTSGVDPVITMHMKSHSNGKWMKSNQIVVHTHDVRVLHLVGKYLVSGGVDCEVIFTKYPPKTVVKHFPFCQGSYSTVAHEASSILLRYSKHLQLWGIGNVWSERGHESPVDLLHIQAKEREVIVASSILSDARWIAYSTQFQNKLYSVKYGDSQVPSEVVKVMLPDEVLSPASNMLFCKVSSKLVIHIKEKIYLLKCFDDIVLLEKTISVDPVSSTEIHLIEISSDDQYLACGCHDGNVIVYDLTTFKLFCKLPKYNFQPTALKFDPESQNVIVAYNDRKIVEYSLESLCYTSWSKQLQLADFMQSYHPIYSMCFCYKKLFLQDESAIYVFDKSDAIEPTKKRVKSSDNSDVHLSNEDVTKITKYQHISSIHSLNDELIVVEMSSNHILNCLPPPIWKKRFGT